LARFANSAENSFGSTPANQGLIFHFNHFNKMQLKNFLLIIGSLFCTSLAFGQTKKIDFTKPDKINIKELLQAAVDNSAKLKSHDLFVAEVKQGDEVRKLQWTEQFTLLTSGFLGANTLDVFNNTQTVATRESLQQNTINYNFGLAARIPLSNFTKRKEEKKLHETVLRKVQSERKVHEDELKSWVLRTFDEFVATNRLIEKKVEYLEVANLQYTLTEKAFSQGNITHEEFTKFLAHKVQAEEELEHLKSMLTLHLHQLQFVTGQL
jgi:hypothetical protein